ncbi:MAG: winged helix-turn-helix transcriptional regulator [Thermoplasmatota archaeon]
MKLTNNSKKVFYSLMKHPEATNKELAEKLDLHESTISKICKNFRKSDILRKTYIINLPGLEEGEIILSNGKFRTKFDEEKKDQIISNILGPGIPFLRAFDDIYWGFMGFRNDSISENSPDDGYKDHTYDLNKYKFKCDEINPHRYFNYLPLIKKTLDGDDNVENTDDKLSNNWSLEDLRDVEKEVIEVLIKYPYDSDFRRSRKLTISNPTFTKIRRDLIEREIILPRYIPKLTEFDFSLIGSFRIKLPKNTKNISKMDDICKLNNHIISLSNKDQVTMISIFKNLKDLTNLLNKGSDLLTNLDISYDNVDFSYVIYDSPNFNKNFEEKDLMKIF